jgi:hypothetical protein
LKMEPLDVLRCSNHSPITKTLSDFSVAYVVAV